MHMMEMIQRTLALVIGIFIGFILVHVASVFVWFLVNYATPGVLVCRANAGQVGWRVERAQRCTFDLLDILPWRFYVPLMRDLCTKYYFSVGYREDFSHFPGSSRLYIHSAPFPKNTFAGVHNIRRVKVRLGIMDGAIRPFHYTVLIDRQASQDGMHQPEDILRNQNFGTSYTCLYGNVVAIKNEVLPLSNGPPRPYEEAVCVVNATMEDTGIIKDVLEVLIEEQTIGWLAMPEEAIWVEVDVRRPGRTPNSHSGGPPPSPQVPPDSSYDSRLSDVDGTEAHMPTASEHPPACPGAPSVGQPARGSSHGAPSHTVQRRGTVPAEYLWSNRVLEEQRGERPTSRASRAPPGRGSPPAHYLWATRVLEESSRILEGSSRGGQRGGRPISRASQASSSHLRGRGRLFGSIGRERHVRIQAPGVVTQPQAQGDQPAQLPDVSLPIVSNEEENILEGGATAPTPSRAPSSDESTGSGEIEYLST
ncbi:hypothetical protein PLEOSDRAFT_1109598 [Pleurotus ostreatus PC15]|uniref:Uncharacterized protein n=1 Tax=Pleurotus ostreatus (strain PC15) TaxID=1137138 RepID=A0A067N397_PLEO1|nr:hypothetical protein PLEOSDRAFT_1109598 [Pleurotus ostreatus PC15]